MSSKVIQQLEVTFMLMVCQIIGLNFTIAEEDGYNGNDHSGVDFNVLDSVKYFQATGSMLPRLGIGLLDVETKEERLRVLDWAFKLGYRMLDVWEGYVLSNFPDSKKFFPLCIQGCKEVSRGETRMTLQGVPKKLSTFKID